VTLLRVVSANGGAGINEGMQCSVERRGPEAAREVKDGQSGPVWCSRSGL
jgi:hypothetical protein